MLNWFHDLGRNYLSAMGVTLACATGVYLVALVLPNHALFAGIFATYIALWAWHFAYTDWVENCLYSQSQETLGRQATVIQTRLALGGAISFLAVIYLASATLNRDLGSTFLKACTLGAVLAVPLSFISHKIRYALMYILREVCLIPVNLIIAVKALTFQEEYLDREFKQVNAAATKIFALVSGYKSNISMLHDVDDILRQLPKRQ